MNRSGRGGSLYCVECGQVLPKRRASTDNTCNACHDDPKRPLGLDEPIPDQGWRAYRVTCTRLGYTYKQAMTRADRERFDREWTWWLRIGAFANETYIGSYDNPVDWGEAEAAYHARVIDPAILAALQHLP